MGPHTSGDVLSSPDACVWGGFFCFQMVTRSSVQRQRMSASVWLVAIELSYKFPFYGHVLYRSYLLGIQSDNSNTQICQITTKKSTYQKCSLLCFSKPVGRLTAYPAMSYLYTNPQFLVIYRPYFVDLILTVFVCRLRSYKLIGLCLTCYQIEYLENIYAVARMSI